MRAYFYNMYTYHTILLRPNKFINFLTLLKSIITKLIAYKQESQDRRFGYGIACCCSYERWTDGIRGLC